VRVARGSDAVAKVLRGLKCVYLESIVGDRGECRASRGRSFKAPLRAEGPPPWADGGSSGHVDGDVGGGRKSSVVGGRSQYVRAGFGEMRSSDGLAVCHQNRTRCVKRDFRGTAVL